MLPRILLKFHRKRLRKFIRLTLYGTILLACLEMGLRAAGYILLRPIESQIASKSLLIPKVGGLTILCIGDSHTYGIGAPKGYSYPDQLEEMIVQKYPGISVQVINGGVPGFNSSQALLRMKHLIKQFRLRPDVIIVNVGKNNDHNLSHATFFEEGLKTASWQDQFRFLLHNSKLYHLGILTRLNIASSLRSPEEAPANNVIKSEKFIETWLLGDFVEFCKVAQRMKSKILFLGYIQSLGLDYVHNPMKRVSEMFLDANFIDVRQPLFLPSHSGGLLNPDWHPTRKGYQRIAARVFAEIGRVGLVEDEASGQPSSSPQER